MKVLKHRNFTTEVYSLFISSHVLLASTYDSRNEHHVVNIGIPCNLFSSIPTFSFSLVLLIAPFLFRCYMVPNKLHAQRIAIRNLIAPSLIYRPPCWAANGRQTKLRCPENKQTRIAFSRAPRYMNAFFIV